jgi:hypothetical protein
MQDLRLMKALRMMKTLTLALLICGIGASVCSAGASDISPASGLLIRADWQDPQFLPPRFRNHCTYENFTGRPYCSNHCGIDYQFYYCSENSFGCCHLGRGYCDFNGMLRCHL